MASSVAPAGQTGSSCMTRNPAAARRSTAETSLFATASSTATSRPRRGENAMRRPAMPAGSCATLAESGSRGSMPAMASNASAMSATVAAIRRDGGRAEEGFGETWPIGDRAIGGLEAGDPDMGWRPAAGAARISADRERHEQARALGHAPAAHPDVVLHDDVDALVVLEEAARATTSSAGRGALWPATRRHAPWSLSIPCRAPRATRSIGGFCRTPNGGGWHERCLAGKTARGCVMLCAPARP